jgi:hypothetical protein
MRHRRSGVFHEISFKSHHVHKHIRQKKPIVEMCQALGDCADVITEFATAPMANPWKTRGKPLRFNLIREKSRRLLRFCDKPGKTSNRAGNKARIADSMSPETGPLLSGQN